MAEKQLITRRTVLKQAAVAAGALAGGPLVLCSCSREAAPRVAPSNRIALGFVGLGTEGMRKNLKVLLKQPDTEVVVLCDVDEERLDEGYYLVTDYYAKSKPSGAYEGCQTTADWREVIAREDIDAVVISTPDHWHVLMAVAAARAGKDIFCEKPVSLTVHEGRVLSDTVRRYGRVFQTGSENRAREGFLRACELVRNGRIGKLHTIRTQLYRGHGMDEIDRIVDPAAESVPREFDYDMWLGQAPEAPYNSKRCHSFFRFIFDYAGGNLTDWGAHVNDVAQWGNNTELTGPISVEGQGVFPEKGLYNVATDWEIAYKYANGVKLICKSGGFSVRFEGTDGWVWAEWDTMDASSGEILAARIEPDDIRLRTCRYGEHRDFIDCVKSRRQPYAPVEVGHRTATIGHIGNIAMRLGRKLRWDPDAERFINDEGANRMLSRPMRSPWRLDA